MFAYYIPPLLFQNFKHSISIFKIRVCFTTLSFPNKSSNLKHKTIILLTCITLKSKEKFLQSQPREAILCFGTEQRNCYGLISNTAKSSTLIPRLHKYLTEMDTPTGAWRTSITSKKSEYRTRWVDEGTNAILLQLHQLPNYDWFFHGHHHISEFEEEQL